MVNASQPSRIAAGTGRAFEVPEEHLVEIVSPEGPQVADTWAFALPGLDEGTCPSCRGGASIQAELSLHRQGAA